MALNIAFVSAGKNGGTPGSPTPVACTAKRMRRDVHMDILRVVVTAHEAVIMKITFYNGAVFKIHTTVHG